MIHPETHVVTLTHGPRPAGPPDRCFYCREPVGGAHAPQCVLRLKTVVVRYSYEIVLDVPEHWKAGDLEYNRNMGSWCADNGVDDLRALVERLGDTACTCDCFTATYVRDATAEDEAAQHVTAKDLIR